MKPNAREAMSIDVTPTKELFIEMLTRDIDLIPAIIDLVDNSVDGATRHASGFKLAGREVHIEVSSTEFRIEDNCGGIPVDTARNYAFRFGRPEGMKPSKGEIGRFGVGMKRALFKLGNEFQVSSVTRTSSFDVLVDVAEWAKEKEWQFEFFEKPEEGQKNDPSEVGTLVVVWGLHEQVAERFESEPFLNSLREQIGSKVREPIARGLLVTLNGEPIQANPLEFLSSSQLAPAYKEVTYKKPGRVRVKLYCGLGKTESPKNARRMAGWYVFCNGRLLLEADKTGATVWGETDDEDGRIPAFHPQYNHFRGYAYFTADDAAHLPWNTTKTGIDASSAVYRAAKLEMVRLSKPVIRFLNRLKQEKEQKEQSGAETPGPLESLILRSATKQYQRVAHRDVFRMPTTRSKARVAGKTARIHYEKPDGQVLEVKRSLGVTTNKEVGEKTFEYYYEAECGNE